MTNPKLGFARVHDVVLVGAAVLGLAGSAAATTARVVGLGGASDYLDDETNVRRWYGSLAGETGLLLVEPGSLSLDARPQGRDAPVASKGGGLIFRLDPTARYGTAGIFFMADQVDARPGGAFGAQYGRAWGRLAAGVSFLGTSSCHSQGSEEDPYDGRSDYFHEIGLGLRWQTRSGHCLEASGEVVNSQFSVSDALLGLNAQGKSTWRGFGLRARAHLRPGAATVVVPLLDYWRDDRGAYADAMPAVAHRDAWQVRIGCGVVRTLSPTRTFVVSGEYRDGKDDYTAEGRIVRYSLSERDYFALHLRVGTEARLRPWLQLRLGAEYRRVDERRVMRRPISWDTRDEIEVFSSVRVETPLTAGCTLETGDLFLDLALAEGTPTPESYLRTENGFADDTHTLVTTLGWRF